jgi:hypothetical protein
VAAASRNSRNGATGHLDLVRRDTVVGTSPFIEHAFTGAIWRLPNANHAVPEQDPSWPARWLEHQRPSALEITTGEHDPAAGASSCIDWRRIECAIAPLTSARSCGTFNRMLSPMKLWSRAIAGGRSVRCEGDTFVTLTPRFGVTFAVDVVTSGFGITRVVSDRSCRHGILACGR